MSEKNIQQIDKKIEELNKKKEELLAIEEQKKNKIQWLKIPELKLEISIPTEWKKPYNEIIIPKDCKLVDIQTLLWIWENEKYRNNYFAYYLKKPFWHIIWCKQLWSDKVNNWSRRLYLGGDVDLGSSYGSLADSGEDGRVAFVRKISRDNK